MKLWMEGLSGPKIVEHINTEFALEMLKFLRYILGLNNIIGMNKRIQLELKLLNRLRNLKDSGFSGFKQNI